jgi:DNA primase
MALYSRESKERVRDAVDFVALVSARTDLRRAGPNRYEGLCPFHDERTPSFGIDPTNKVYYCFGCQASGDVFTFVQETEGVDFKGSLELLADRCGIELEREQEDPRGAERRHRRERLLELLARTAAYYERYLWESGEAAKARTYLAGRGLREEALRAFRVGYAPSAWDRVLLASRRGGFTEEELYATGLAQRSRQDGRLYDRFRERIMFPLADVRGRVLGFGARAMRDNQQPKYLNTSDNDVYHKGLHLYGADLARSHVARAGNVILCEGYTDVIALHQAGLLNAVGLMGTALTAEQVAELARMASVVLLALDADSAGREAMLRAAQLAARRKLELRVVTLPAGTDPAELVQRDGLEAMRAAVDAAVPFVRFRVERVLAAGDHGSPQGRDRMVEQLGPVFAQLPPSAMREELVRMVSGRLALGESVVEAILAAAASAGTRPAEGSAGREPASGTAAGGARRRVPGPLDRREENQRAFLALCLALPDRGHEALAAVDLEEHFTGDLVRRAAAHLRDHLDAPAEGLPDDDPELAALIAQLTVRAGGEPAQPETLEVQSLQLEIASIERQMQAARAEGRGDVTELARRREELKRSFDRAQDRALEATGGRA